MTRPGYPRTPYAMRTVLARMQPKTSYTARMLATKEHTEDAIWQLLNRARQFGLVKRTNREERGRGVRALYEITKKGSAFLRGE